MAWIYFQELVESDSHSNLGSEQLHTVSENSTHKAYYCPECNQVKLTLPQSGMMSQHCAEKCSLKSTSSSEASHAKTLVLQDMGKVWQESEAVFSSRLSAWSKKSHPHLSFWKTYQPSELAVFLKSSMPLQKSGMIVGGLVCLPQALEPFTNVNDGSYLPTPTAVRYGSNKGGAAGRTGKERLSLEVMATRNLWPTPCARDWKDTGKSPSEMERNSTTLATIAGGQLNPQWVEWLMGYKTGYTELNVLVTEWFRSKSKRRSKN